MQFVMHIEGFNWWCTTTKTWILRSTVSRRL